MIGNSWDIVLAEEFKKDYFKKIAVNTNILYKQNLSHVQLLAIP